MSEYIISQVVNGLCQGFIYALIALGFAVIVGIVGFSTFTHGEVLMIGAYASFYVFTYCGHNLLLGLLGSFAASWIIGIVIYKLCYERFMDSPEHISLICTIGFSMLLKNLAQIVFGTEKKPMLNIIDNQIYHLGPVNISKVQLLVILTVLILSSALMLIFNKTRWGVALRSVSQNREAAALVGINVRQTAMIGNCIGCAMAGVAGMLIGIYYQSISPTMGSTLSMKAFAAGMNPRETDSLMEFMLLLKQKGYTIAVIEHDMKFVMNSCDHILVLNFGQKICEGDPDHVKNDANVQEAYFGKGTIAARGTKVC